MDRSHRENTRLRCLKEASKRFRCFNRTGALSRYFFNYFSEAALASQDIDRSCQCQLKTNKAPGR